jgi:hypothetical protein
MDATMIFAKLSAGAIGVACWSIATVTPLAAQVWEQRCVLLTTDRVITGQVQQQGEQVRIKQNEGNEIRVDRKQVAAIGATVRDLYQYKLSRLPKTARGGDHQQLSRWCLSVNLLAEAGQHYLQLTRSHPANSNQSVKQLGFEIKDKMLQQNDFRVALGLPPLDRQNSVVSSTMNSNPSATQGLAVNVVVASTASNNNAPGVLPSRVHARFMEQTQHILINRCGQAACHGHATKTPFRLMEVGGRDASAQTQQNLESVLRYVDNDPKTKSMLIEYLTNNHAKQNGPPIGPREAHLVSDVVNWVQLVQNPVVSAEAWGQPNALNPLNPGAPQLRQVPRPPTLDPASENAEFPAGADIPTVAELDALEAQVRQQEAASPAAVPSSSDPFDPSEFNRQTARKE